MSKFYIAIKTGVYRHETLGASLNKEDMLQVAIDYFKTTDDYHTVVIEEVVVGGEANVVEEYFVKSASRKVWKHSLL